MSKYNDTIYALSTPTGKSAIALIRVSGKDSLETIKKISSIKKISPNKTKVTFLNFKNKTIDQVIITYFKQTKSFTGEDMFEINCHGSSAIISKILETSQNEMSQRFSGEIDNRKKIMAELKAITKLRSAKNYLNLKIRQRFWVMNFYDTFDKNLNILRELVVKELELINN